MPNIKKIVLAAVLAGSTALVSVPAQSFWGPFDWVDDGPGWGGPWGGGPWGGGPWGYPRYGYGYPGYGWGGYPGYGYGGYPGYGWGGYPGYGYGGYPGYGYGYPYATPLVPTVPAPAAE